MIYISVALKWVTSPLCNGVLKRSSKQSVEGVRKEVCRHAWLVIQWSRNLLITWNSYKDHKHFWHGSRCNNSVANYTVLTNAHYHTYEVSYLTADSVSIQQNAMKCRLTANVINSQNCGSFICMPIWCLMDFCNVQVFFGSFVEHWTHWLLFMSHKVPSRLNTKAK